MAYVNRGFKYFNINEKDDRSFTDFNNAVNTDPNFSIAYFARSHTYFAKGDIDHAITDMSKSIDLGLPKLQHCQALHIRGNLYGFKSLIPSGEPLFVELAIQDQSGAIKLCTDKKLISQAYYMRGLDYDTKKDYSNAINDFTHSLTITPNNAKALYQRGTDEKALGRATDAERDIAAAKQIDPHVNE